MTVEGVAVEVDLSVEAVEVAFVGDHQRVDLQQRQVLVVEQLGQAEEDLGELLDLVALEAQREGQLTGLVRLRTDQWIDLGLENLLWRLCSDRLYLGAALGGSHHNVSAG